MRVARARPASPILDDAAGDARMLWFASLAAIGIGAVPSAMLGGASQGYARANGVLYPLAGEAPREA